MILHPGIIALVTTSLLICGMLLYVSGHAVQILRSWDLASGSERQLSLERKTYLVSTVLAYSLGFQLISLFLFIYVADSISSLFVGAMCAVGSLTVNPFGYPTLLLKLVNFLLAGLWLILNHADSRGHDYPLIRQKYTLLLVMVPLIVAETASQLLYFAGLRPDIITSCCGSLFGAAGRGVATELANLPARPMLFIFYGFIAVTLAAGFRFVLRGRGAQAFAVLSGASSLVSLAAVISVISLYIYELPTHHCPFCILQREYHFIGYPLYLALLTGFVSGCGVGVLGLGRGKASLADDLPQIRRRLAITAMLSFAVLLLIATLVIVRTSFRLTS